MILGRLCENITAFINNCSYNKRMEVMQFKEEARCSIHAAALSVVYNPCNRLQAAHRLAPPDLEALSKVCDGRQLIL
jgi:hypothetical protein